MSVILLRWFSVPFVLLSLFVFLRADGFFAVDKVHLATASHQPVWLETFWSELRAELQEYQGADIFSLNLVELRKQVMQKIWVADVRVRRSWPNDLYFEIVHKDLSAYGRDQKGGLVPLLQDGTPIAPSALPEKMDLPVLSSSLSQDSRERIVTAIRLYRLFPIEKGLTRDRVSEIGYDAKEGYWTLILPLGTRIKWGESDFENKIARVRQVIDYLESRAIQARVIDANLAKKVVVRLRKTP